ncbi:MAG: hypothetical protein DHS20C11_06710 [Lysobacteraceae bacterium]|nr:MAG: hypothetical protein DHS20C11_06710 [Xanthomonadaceae bacterium]
MSVLPQPSWLRVTFLFAVSLLFTHELDAMTHAEWDVLPLTSWLPPDVGRAVFVTIHVPIFAFVLGWLTSRLPERVASAQFWISAFLVVHAALHFAFSSHPEYTFEGLLSNTLIFGSAALGAVYLLGSRSVSTVDDAEK